MSLVKLMRRLPFLLVALLVIAPACSFFGTAPAATVDGTEITVRSIDDEMKTIRANDEYRTVLEQSYGSPTADTSDTAAKGTFNSAFVAQILALRIWYRKIEGDLTERGLKVTPDVLAQATNEIEQQFSSLGPEVFKKFPKEYRDRLIRQRALITLVDQEITTDIGIDEQAFYDANKDTFAEICLSHALVGLQGGRTAEEAKARAQELYDRIQSGETTFEEVATDESDDTASAAAAGDLGCGSQVSLQFDPVFEKAAFALTKGVVSEPVQTQFGSHLILVTKRTIPSYAKVADTVQQVMQQTHDNRVNDYLTSVICRGKVDVNPRYGTWGKESCDGLSPQLPQVKPPEGPIGATTTTTVFVGG